MAMSAFNRGKVEQGGKNNLLKKQLKDDPWALKAIQYLIRMDYSSQEIQEALIEIGIRWGGRREITNQEASELQKERDQ